MFKGLKPTVYIANVANMEDEARNGPYSFYLTNTDSSTAEEGGVMVEFSQLGSLRPDIFTPEGLQTFNNETLKTNSFLQV